MLRLCVVIIAVVSCNALLGESRLKAELDSINKNLVNAVHSADSAENFKFLHETLDEKSNKLLWKNSKYVKALKKLIALKSDQCDLESYENFKEITDSLDEGLQYFSTEVAHSKTLIPIKRISKIVRELSMQHAKHCQEVYFDLFESKVANLNQQQVGFVKNFYDMIATYLGHLESYNRFHFRTTNWLIGYDRSLEALFKRLLENTSIDWKDHRRYVYEALKTNAKDDLDSKYLKRVLNEISGTVELNKPKFKELYNKYLIIPCKYYTNELKDVFAPAAYDAEMYHDFDKNKAEFYYSWARFKLCNQLLSEESRVLKNSFYVAD